MAFLTKGLKIVLKDDREEEPKEKKEEPEAKNEEPKGDLNTKKEEQEDKIR